MSKVKIQGNASGTGVVTLTAPNTNTDRTITLPDGDISLGVGIDDNATSTAITIDASENVGIGTSSPSTFNQRVTAPHLVVGTGGNSAGLTLYSGTTSQSSINFAVGTTTSQQYDGGFTYVPNSGSPYLSFHVNAGTERMRITSDGRGLSQFTAKAWVNFNGSGTVAIRYSHNVSSITDIGVGRYNVNFTTAMTTTNYSAVYDAASVNNNAGNATYVQDRLTTHIHVKHYENGTNYDPVYNSAIVFGD